MNISSSSLEAPLISGANPHPLSVILKKGEQPASSATIVVNPVMESLSNVLNVDIPSVMMCKFNLDSAARVPE